MARDSTTGSSRDTTAGGRYAHGRLALVAAAWLIAAGATLALAPQLAFVDSPSLIEAGAVAPSCQDGNAAPDDPPCQFPVESGMGGLILGQAALIGNDLGTWFGEQPGASPGSLTAPTAPGRVEPDEEVAAVGMNQLTIDGFYAYKSWMDTHHRTGGTFHTYFWMSSNNATLEGTPECATADGEPLSQGRENCDLLVEVTEMATKDFSASGEAPVIKTINIDSGDYWVNDAARDDCGLSLTDACLGILESGAKTQDLLSDATVNLDGLLLRVHRVSAIPSDDDPPVSKILTLNDVYLEMRYGKGSDRAYVPVPGSYPDVGPPYLRNGQGGPQSRKAAISNGYDCEGNPMGVGDTSCTDIPSNQVGVTSSSYQDIHR